MMKIDYTTELVSITLIFSMQQNINQSYEIRLSSTFTSFLTSFFTSLFNKIKQGYLCILLFHSCDIYPSRLLFVCSLPATCRSLSALLLLAPILIIILLIPTIPISVTITLLIIIALTVGSLSIAFPVTPWLRSPIILLAPTFLRLTTWPVALLTPHGLLRNLIIPY